MLTGPAGKLSGSATIRSLRSELSLWRSTRPPSTNLLLRLNDWHARAERESRPKREAEMRKSLNSTLAATLCGATAFAALPSEVLAGPMSVASPSSVGLTAPAEKIYYRRYYGPRRYYGGYYRRRYYRHYGYDPSGAIFAGAALGLLG